MQEYDHGHERGKFLSTVWTRVDEAVDAAVADTEEHRAFVAAAVVALEGAVRHTGGTPPVVVVACWRTVVAEEVQMPMEAAEYQMTWEVVVEGTMVEVDTSAVRLEVEAEGVH